MVNILAGDIGGTKTLLSLYSLKANQLEPLASERYGSAAWDDLAPMVRHFLARAGPAARHPAVACFAVAGPVQSGQARLTNLPWRLSEADLSARCEIKTVELVNDFAVLIYGLPHLSAHQRAPIRSGQTVGGEPVLILGAGTGLGVAIGIPGPEGLRAVASEAAHGSFAPRSEREWELREWLQHDLQLERVSIERVVSGTGLGHTARWLLDRYNHAGDHPLTPIALSWQNTALGSERDDLPAAVARAAGQGDALAAEALDIWLAAYGAVVGDLALTCLSRGGIWLAGGTAAKMLTELRSEVFSGAFLDKGRLRETLEPLSIQAVIDPALGSFSAACRARILLGSSAMDLDPNR